LALSVWRARTLNAIGYDFNLAVELLVDQQLFLLVALVDIFFAESPFESVRAEAVNFYFDV
jgi:hypothetical protein